MFSCCVCCTVTVNVRLWTVKVFVYKTFTDDLRSICLQAYWLHHGCLSLINTYSYTEVGILYLCHMSIDWTAVGIIFMYKPYRHFWEWKSHFCRQIKFFFQETGDYSTAFDTINHSILFRKFLSHQNKRTRIYLEKNGLSSVVFAQVWIIPAQIQRWIFHFFTGRRPAVQPGGEQSRWLPIDISRAVIVQGSGIGPSAYSVYSTDLKTQSQYN